VNNTPRSPGEAIQFCQVYDITKATGPSQLILAHIGSFSINLKSFFAVGESKGIGFTSDYRRIFLLIKKICHFPVFVPLEFPS
jgi:hypothetical protein